VADESNKMIPKLLQGLSFAKQVSCGRWLNTQQNAFALLAFDNYFTTYEKNREPNFTTSVFVENFLAAEHKFKGFTTDQFSTKIPNRTLLASGNNNANPSKEEDKDVSIALLKEGTGRLYYRLAYQAALSNPFVAALDRGFTVTRKYEALDDPKDLVIRKKDKETDIFIKAGSRVKISLNLTTTNYKFYVALVDHLPGGLESINLSPGGRYRYRRDWYNHYNLRDERAEVYSDYLNSGIHNFSYNTRATTLGTFFVPPAKAEEMYAPEVFGRSDVVRVTVTEEMPSA